MSVKSKRSSPLKNEANALPPIPLLHSFSTCEISHIRTALLAWYYESGRDLPWRRIAKNNSLSDDDRGYAVWVSEVMLQQTQVATVIPYYTRWMDKWPNIQSLSTANEEEVMTAWKGLGYYNRAKRLWEGSKLLVQDYGGVFPNTSTELRNILHGVGQYTSCAIASIVNGEQCGVVDGNVIRVLCRLRVIGGDVTTSRVKAVFWELINNLVTQESPGDFNQSIMELGATVCTPQTPLCGNCPINSVCTAYLNDSLYKNAMKKSENSIEDFFAKETIKINPTDLTPDIEDISGFVAKKEESHCLKCEDNCDLCLPQNSYKITLGVTNYPSKVAKKPPKPEYFAVCLFETNYANTSDSYDDSDERQFLLVKRSQTGLLANFMEFPSFKYANSNVSVKKFEEILVFDKDIKFESTFLGVVTHVFSHLVHTYSVFHARIPDRGVAIQIMEYYSKLNEARAVKWMTLKEINNSAVPTGMHKILNLLIDKGDDVISNVQTSRPKREVPSEELTKYNKRQKTMNSYFPKLT